MGTNDFEVHGHLHLEPGKAQDDTCGSVISSSPTDAEKYMTKKKTQLEQKFQNAMCQEFQIADRYAEVAVLMIKWTDVLDNLRVENEVRELEALFKKDYKFTTKILELNTLTRPQSQLNAAVSTFVRDHEGSARNNLLIVYYSGHGSGEEGSFELEFRGVLPEDIDVTNRSFAHDPVVNWNRAEKDLDDAHADVLLILDCCSAGNLIGKGGDREKGCFEVLTATGRSQKAERPGPHSYTRHLIDVLREEVKNTGPPALTTVYLNELITRRSQQFKTHYFSRHGKRTDRIIALAPIADEKDTRQPGMIKNTGNTATLDLKVVFETSNILTVPDAEALAQELSRAAKETDKDGKLGIYSINWVNYQPSVSALLRSVHRASRLRVRYATRWQTIALKRKREGGAPKADTKRLKIGDKSNDPPTPATTAASQSPSPRP